nr:hypothetical protein [Marinicella sp. W31]MDC2880251.1 hypothetical protein [Marinicella sp. W31]
MPPLIRAGLPVGSYELSMEDGTRHAMTVHNGVHDSNAAFSFYTNLGYSNFTLVSTGTWVVTMNTDAPYSVMDENRDMLTNVTVDKQPIATARFMGGREFDLISEKARVAITASDIQAVIDKQQMALPSFADGGPFPGRHGKLIGPEANSARERAAIATLYLACMTNLTLDLLQSNNTVVIDGGLSNNAMYGPLINALRPSQTVLNNEQAEGTAAGAAALAFGSFTNSPFKDPCKVCETVQLEGLEHYYERWRMICLEEQ